MFYMSKEEMRDFREIIEETKLPCSDYWAKHDAFRRSEIFSKDKSQEQQQDILRTISEFISSFPKANIKSFDPTNYAVTLYNLMCAENGLSQRGVVWFLQSVLMRNKLLPTIAEMVNALDDLNLQYDEFERSYEFFLRKCEYQKQQFVDMYNASEAAQNLSSVLNIKEAIESWDTLFPNDPFPCAYDDKGFNEEKAERIIRELSLRKSKNIMLLLLLSVIAVSKLKDINHYDPASVLDEMEKLYPKNTQSKYGRKYFNFYTPDQWQKIDLTKAEKYPAKEHWPGFMLFEPSYIHIFLDRDKKDGDFIHHFEKITREYFEIKGMFE